MNQNHAQTLYDDDYAAYCSQQADHFCDNLKDAFPRMSKGECSEEIGDFLHDMGSSYKQIAVTLSKLEACKSDEQAADVLRTDFDELEQQNSIRLRDIVGRKLFNDFIELDHFRETAREKLDSSLEQQGIQSLPRFEPVLFLDRDADTEVSVKRGKNLADLLEGTYDDILDYQQMEIYRNENEPCLRAHLHDDLHGFHENVTIVPKELAREAYSSDKGIRTAIQQAMLSSEMEEVMDFMKAAHAIPELEKDPSTYGIVRGIYSLSEDMSGSLETISLQIANFDKQDFEKTYKENFEDAVSNAYDIESNTYDCSYSYFYENNPLPHQKSNDVSKGIHKLLKEGNLDKLQETIGGYLRGERTATKALQKLGKSQERSR